jgi:hypothetical protein
MESTLFSVMWTEGEMFGITHMVGKINSYILVGKPVGKHALGDKGTGKKIILK